MGRCVWALIALMGMTRLTSVAWADFITPELRTKCTKSEEASLLCKQFHGVHGEAQCFHMAQFIGCAKGEDVISLKDMRSEMSVVCRKVCRERAAQGREFDDFSLQFRPHKEMLKPCIAGYLAARDPVCDNPTTFAIVSVAAIRTLCSDSDPSPNRPLEKCEEGMKSVWSLPALSKMTGDEKTAEIKKAFVHCKLRMRRTVPVGKQTDKEMFLAYLATHRDAIRLEELKAQRRAEQEAAQLASRKANFIASSSVWISKARKLFGLGTKYDDEQVLHAINKGVSICDEQDLLRQTERSYATVKHGVVIATDVTKEEMLGNLAADAANYRENIGIKMESFTDFTGKKFSFKLCRSLEVYREVVDAAKEVGMYFEREN